MSDRIIKLQSQQNYQEQAIEGAFINKLIDFHIPGSGLSYDLSKSYINLNMEILNNGLDANGVAPDGVLPSDKALFRNGLQLANEKGGTFHHLANNAQIVRNADMFSANRGMVESIRRVNVLRSVLWNVENDEAEMRNGLDKIGQFKGRRGLGNQTSQSMQDVGQNVDMAGNQDNTIASKDIARDYRIPLSDLFGVGSAQWNSNYFGETRIHLEIQPNLLHAEPLGGAEDSSPFSGQAFSAAPVNYGAMLSYNAGASQLPNLPISSDLGLANFPLITELTYDDPGLDFPFHVGQAVIVSFANTGTAPIAAPTTSQIISGIEHITEATKARLGALTTPLANVLVGQVAITFRQAIISTGVTNPAVLGTVTLKASLSQPAGNLIAINRAELVLSEMEGDGPMGMEYSTYSTEETQGIGTQTLNQQVMIEPNCSNLIVANCGQGFNFVDRPWFQYRIAIDNVDQSGNRDIVWGESLHKNRMERFFKNRGQRFTNSTLRQIGCNQVARVAAIPATAPAGSIVDGNQVRFYPILETMPITTSTKIVNLELEGTAGNPPQDVIFFKELQRSI